MSNFEKVYEILEGALQENTEDDVPVFRSIIDYNGQLVVGNVWAYGKHYPNMLMWAVPGSAKFMPGESSAGGGLAYKIGDILNMKLLSRKTLLGSEEIKNIIVYGTEGVAMLTPQDFPASFGYFVFSDVPGIASQLAVAGDEHYQVYVGTDKKLRVISAEGIGTLGYDEFLSEGSEFVVSYCSTRGEFYVSY
jgi:hypothetical protein